jgi:hypothetical protein
MKAIQSLVGFTLILLSTPVYAGDTCPKSYANVQFAKRDLKLSLAREEARQCISQCSSAFRKECEDWLSEVEQSMPTIVISARTAEGRDLTEVSTTMDGSVLAGKADGSPLQVDPGEHHFSFSRAGAAAVEQTLVIRAGEKNRNVPVVLTLAPVAAPGLPLGQTPATPIDRGVPSEPHRNWTLPVLAGGIGALGLITAGVLGVTVLASISTCEGTFNKRCATQEEWDSLSTRKTLTNVALGVGVLGVVSSGVLYLLTAPAPSTSSKTWTLSPQLAASPQGGALYVSGKF